MDDNAPRFEAGEDIRLIRPKLNQLDDVARQQDHLRVTAPLTMRHTPGGKVVGMASPPGGYGWWLYTGTAAPYDCQQKLRGGGSVWVNGPVSVTGNCYETRGLSVANGAIVFGQHMDDGSVQAVYNCCPPPTPWQVCTCVFLACTGDPTPPPAVGALVTITAPDYTQYTCTVPYGPSDECCVDIPAHSSGTWDYSITLDGYVPITGTFVITGTTTPVCNCVAFQCPLYPTQIPLSFCQVLSCGCPIEGAVWQVEPGGIYSTTGANGVAPSVMIGHGTYTYTLSATGWQTYSGSFTIPTAECSWCICPPDNGNCVGYTMALSSGNIGMSKGQDSYGNCEPACSESPPSITVTLSGSCFTNYQSTGIDITGSYSLSLQCPVGGPFSGCAPSAGWWYAAEFAKGGLCLVLAAVPCDVTVSSGCTCQWALRAVIQGIGGRGCSGVAVCSGLQPTCSLPSCGGTWTYSGTSGCPIAQTATDGLGNSITWHE